MKRYTRVDHCKKWMDAIQAKENDNIPSTIILKLREELADKKLVVTKESISLILKQERLAKYYDNINLIYHKLTGIKICTITEEVENRLIELIRRHDERSDRLPYYIKPPIINYEKAVSQTMLEIVEERDILI